MKPDLRAKYKPRDTSDLSTARINKAGKEAIFKYAFVKGKEAFYTTEDIIFHDGSAISIKDLEILEILNA